MTDTDVHGPIDFVLIEYPADQLKGECAAEVLKLIDAGIIRLYDAVLIAKDADGGWSSIEIADTAFAEFAGARSGLIGDEDIEEAAGALEPGTVAVLLVYENAWATGFIAAARRAGGQLVASAHIPAAAVLEALEALDGES